MRECSGRKQCDWPFIERAEKLSETLQSYKSDLHPVKSVAHSTKDKNGILRRESGNNASVVVLRIQVLLKIWQSRIILGH